MSSMNPDARAAELDQLFTRTLLESADADELPVPATNAAWEKFAVALAVAALPVGSQVSGGAFASKGAARIAARWLVLGALGGSSLTFAWMRHEQNAQRPKPLHGVVVGTTATRSSAPLPQEPTAIAAIPPTTPSRPDIELRRHGSLKKMAPASAKSARLAPSPVHTTSLAAEVSALDDARTASSTGNYDEALRLIAAYHRDFPAGELSADADVVAIDALFAKGDEAGAARRATEFLDRYPNDPHAAHLKRIAER